MASSYLLVFIRMDAALSYPITLAFLCSALLTANLCCAVRSELGRHQESSSERALQNVAFQKRASKNLNCFYSNETGDIRIPFSKQQTVDSMFYGLCFEFLLALSAASNEIGTAFGFSGGSVHVSSSVHSVSRLQACQRPRPVTPLFLSAPAVIDNGVASDAEDLPKKKKNSALLDLNQEVNRWAEAAGNAIDSQASIDAAKTAEGIWLRSLKDHPENVDIISYNTVLKAWSRCSHRLTDFRYGFVDTSNQQGDSSNFSKTRDVGDSLPPCTVNVNIYTPKDAVLRAQDWLYHPPSVGTDEEQQLEPDVQSYNIVMDAWSKSRDQKAPQHVEHIFQRLQEHGTPDLMSYNALLDAYAHAPKDYQNRLDKVKQLWAHVKELSNTGVEGFQPSIQTVNSVLHAYTRQAQHEPDQAVALSLEAMGILEEAEKEASEGGEQLDVMTYTSVMECWSRAARIKTKSFLPQDQAEKLLAKMNERASAAKTERDRMRVAPNIYTYTTLLKTWARANYRFNPVAKCEALLDKLFDGISSPEGSEATDGIVYPRVNVVACTVVMQAYARSNDPNKAQKALKLLQRMRKSDLEPTLISYNAALDVCARTKGTVEQQTTALKIAFAVFKSIQLEKEKMTANHVTFGSLLHAVAFLMPPSDERNSVASATFSKAVTAGQVDQTVVRNLQKACDAEVYHRLLEQDRERYIDFDKLPPAWGRNVRSTY